MYTIADLLQGSGPPPCPLCVLGGGDAHAHVHVRIAQYGQEPEHSKPIYGIAHTPHERTVLATFCLLHNLVLSPTHWI